MEQLTQMELLQVQELIGMETLAAKKCKVYARETTDPQLKQLFDEGAALHQQQLNALVNQLRLHNGRPPNPAQTPDDQH